MGRHRELRKQRAGGRGSTQNPTRRNNILHVDVCCGLRPSNIYTGTEEIQPRRRH